MQKLLLLLVSCFVLQAIALDPDGATGKNAREMLKTIVEEKN